MIGLVINLQKDSDRIRRLAPELRKWSFPFYRVDAVYGKGLTPGERGKLATPACQTFCTPQMIGCAASHLKACVTFLETNEDVAMICEDDVVFTDGAPEILAAALNELPADFDIVYGGCFHCAADKDGRTWISWLLQVSNLSGFGLPEPRRASEHLYVPHLALGLHCYLVSRKGARKLVSRLLGRIPYHLDYEINREFAALKVLAITPQIAVQRDIADSHTLASGLYPVLLNRPARLITSGGHTGDYIMSVPWFRVPWFDLTVNGWVTVLMVTFLVAGAVSQRHPAAKVFAAVMFSSVTIPDVASGTLSSPVVPLLFALVYLTSGGTFP